MITQPETLVDAANEVGIEVPANLHDYDKSKYLFWYFFCLIQIDRPMPTADSHRKNARVVADVDPKRIGDISFRDIADFLE